MSHVSAALSYRQDIIESLKDRFLAHLEKVLEEGRDPQAPPSELIELRSQYQNLFSNYLTTGFDVIFRNELESVPLSGSEVDDKLDISITDDDLQNLDEGINQVAKQRKFLPARCSVLQQKILHLESEAALKIKSNVKSVPVLTDENLPSVQIETDVENNLFKLQTEMRETIEKARRVAIAANILLETKETLENIASN